MALNETPVAVLGGGSFGTVLANIAAENGRHVRFWMRSETLAAQVNTLHENQTYLPGYRLSERVRATHDMAAAVADANLVFVAVPSHSFRVVVRDMLPHVAPETPLISTTKGIEAGTFLLMSQVLREESPSARVGVLSGPNLAKEIAQRFISATVIASEHGDVRDAVKKALSCDYFRVYANDDCFGVELGGSLKNIYAIIAGMAHELGMGYNTNSMLITRSLAEMARFGRAVGADPMTFMGLAGVGDLVVTCSTPLSRNYRLGQALARGVPLEVAARDIGQTAEGVNTLRQVKEKADALGVYMPLVEALHQVLFAKESIGNIIGSLMVREQSLDVEFAAGDLKQLNHKE